MDKIMTASKELVRAVLYPTLALLVFKYYPRPYVIKNDEAKLVDKRKNNKVLKVPPFLKK